MYLPHEVKYKDVDGLTSYSILSLYSVECNIKLDTNYNILEDKIARASFYFTSAIFIGPELV